MFTATAQIPFAFNRDRVELVQPPRVGDQAMIGSRRTVVTSIDTDRENNPRGAIVCCVTYLDNGGSGVSFWHEHHDKTEFGVIFRR